MTKKIKNILRGVGSVIDIAPRTDFNKFVPKQTPAERMAGHWQKTGQQIQEALIQVANEPKNKR